ncbi:MAG: capsular biosynthesis protein [Alteraurantiacibacter sp. bin_em_oilr2.035]|nr:capsular biosynthesis protein [Aurantiacibacter atlanticus]MDF1833593.1 capsular biosynthesis protein [Alteraurantiacibacter sp. bin_em_oilr2.035]
MTKHSKIPTPGKSLFERAEGFFGLGEDLTPAPVPHELAKPVNRRITRRDVTTKVTELSLTEAALQGIPTTEAFIPEPVYEDVTFSQDIHEIDRDALARHGLIQPEGPISALLEEFRIVKRQVLQSVRKARENGSGKIAQRVLICSPLPNEGKSFCAANLALAMAAEKDSEVLLVDADFAKPSILSMLGLPRGPGFMDVLARDDIRVEDCVMATDIAGLHVLPAGNHTTSDSEFLSSTRTADVLDRLTRAAPNRIVIFDSSPALAASPAAELANHVGQALVVARADRTGQSALEDALTLLSACPDLKLLLNAAHFSPSGRRFGAYYEQEA